MARKPYFPHSPTKLDYIYYHLGRTSVSWANTEVAVDLCLRVFAAIIQDPLYVPPYSTKKRITALSRFLRKINLPQEHKAKGNELLRRYKYLAWHRNWATHGIIPTKSFIGQTWKRQKGLVAFERVNLSTGQFEALEIHLNDIEGMGQEALDLHHDIFEWVNVDLGCSTPKKTKQFISKVRGQIA